MSKYSRSWSSYQKQDPFMKTHRRLCYGGSAFLMVGALAVTLLGWA